MNNQSGLWLVTFGDLLTLLLCLFVMLAAVNRPNFSAIQPDSLDVSCATEESCLSERLGIPLANSPGQDNQRRSFGIHGSELVVEVTGEQMADESRFPDLSHFSICRSITIESCGDDGDREHAWVVASQRALAIRERLLTHSVGAQTIAVRALGPDCPQELVKDGIVARLILDMS